MQMHNLLGFGVIRERNDNMVEYVITSIDAVEKFLLLLKPYIIIKKNILIKVLKIIKLKRSVNNVNDFIKICELVDSTLDDTDGKNRIINSLYVKAKLKDKFPVETLLK